MSLLVRWRAIRCTGRDRGTGRPCTQVNFEVQATAPKLRYRFRCKKCGSWCTVEV